MNTYVVLCFIRSHFVERACHALVRLLETCGLTGGKATIGVGCNSVKPPDKHAALFTDSAQGRNKARTGKAGKGCAFAADMWDSSKQGSAYFSVSDSSGNNEVALRERLQTMNIIEAHPKSFTNYNVASACEQADTKNHRP
jgi:hypothetical protein